jgi:hypothetical protein
VILAFAKHDELDAGTPAEWRADIRPFGRGFLDRSDSVFDLRRNRICPSTRNHMLGVGQQEIDKRQAWKAKIVRLEPWSP